MILFLTLSQFVTYNNRFFTHLTILRTYSMIGIIFKFAKGFLAIKWSKYAKNVICLFFPKSVCAANDIFAPLSMTMSTIFCKGISQIAKIIFNCSSMYYAVCFSLNSFTSSTIDLRTSAYTKCTVTSKKLHSLQMPHVRQINMFNLSNFFFVRCIH